MIISVMQTHTACTTVRLTNYIYVQIGDGKHAAGNASFITSLGDQYRPYSGLNSHKR